MTECSDGIVARLKQELDDQFVGGDHHQASVVLNEVQQIQGEMRSLLNKLNNPNQGDVGQQGDAAIEVGQGSQQRPVYYWGGKMHNVPEGFKIPRMTLGSLITCWFVGDKRDGIPPLRFVQCYDLVDKKMQKL